MKRILVLGVKGMAGHLLYEYFEKAGFAVYGVARNIRPSDHIFDLDVSNTSKLTEILMEYNFDIVVNCIGILNKDAEENPEKAIWFNSYFPHFLVGITKTSNTKIIHVSTDCVFSGMKGGYTENDHKDGIGYYAQSKALGEIDNQKDLTIRTSIIGPELNSSGIGLFHWFMTRNESEQIRGFTNAFWSGITTLELAKVIIEAINQQISGLIQIARKDKIDKYSLLKLFNRIYRANKLSIIGNDAYKVDKSLISIRQDFDYQLPTYEEMLIEQLNWIRGSVYNYQNYNIG